MKDYVRTANGFRRRNSIGADIYKEKLANDAFVEKRYRKPRAKYLHEWRGRFEEAVRIAKGEEE